MPDIDPFAREALRRAAQMNRRTKAPEAPKPEPREEAVPEEVWIASYPEDLPEKNRRGITVWFFNMMGSLPFRIILGFLISTPLINPIVTTIIRAR